MGPARAIWISRVEHVASKESNITLSRNDKNKGTDVTRKQESKIGKECGKLRHKERPALSLLRDTSSR